MIGLATPYLNLVRFIPEYKVLGLLRSKGYQFITLTMLFKKELGYKNSEHITKETGISNSYLRIKFAYKDSLEYADLTKEAGLLAKELKMRHERNQGKRFYSTSYYYIVNKSGLKKYIATDIVHKLITVKINECISGIS